MAREELEVHLTARDDASDVVKELADRAERLGDEEYEFQVKAQIKSAEADIRRLRRQLKDVDDEEVEARILADIETAKKDLRELDDILDDLDAKRVEPEVDAPDAEQAGVDAGELFGAGALKGLGAAGLAAGIAEAFTLGAERNQMRARLQQQFGLIEDDAKRFGETASQLYVDQWADSTEQAYEALGRVQQQLVTTGDVTEDEMERVTQSALAVATTFGVDVSEVIRSMGQLLQNDLAPNAETALDTIVAGFQNGGDEAGDFLETLDEYAQHFSAMGLSGDEATSIIVHGLQNGQRDADKLADAIKEMRLRAVDDADAVSEAYESLGLDADEYREKIAQGGDTAREAYYDILTAINDIEDPTEKHNVAVELIGTQYEDLGPKAIDSLLAARDATIETENATRDLETALDEVAPKSESAFRQFKESATGAFAAADTELGEYLASQQEVGDRLQAQYEAQQRVNEGVFAGAIALAAQRAELERVGDGALLLGQDITSMAGEVDGAANAADDHVDSLDDQEEALDRVTEATDETTRSLSELRLEQLAQVDPTFAAMRAVEAHEQALAALNEEGGYTPENLRNVVIASGEMEAAMLTAATQANLTGDELYQMGLDAGLSEDQAYDLAVQLALTEQAADDFAGEYAAELLANPDDALADIAEVNRAVTALDGRVANVTVRVRQDGRVDLNDGRGNRSTVSHVGSRFNAGDAAVVTQEQVFVADQPGRLMSREASQRMARGDGGGMAAASGGMRPIVIQVAGVGEVHGMVEAAQASILESLEKGMRP